jgi:hypothetical protein
MRRILWLLLSSTLCAGAAERTELKPLAQTNYYHCVYKASKQKVMRFTKMPVAVYVSPPPNSQYGQACNEAMKYWEERTDREIQFVAVGSRKQARIVLEWRKLGTARTEKGTIHGASTVTKWRARPPLKLCSLDLGPVAVPLCIPSLRLRYRAKPQIVKLNTDLIETRAPGLRLVLLRNLVAHELGHALGLLGHSESPEDLMYSQTDERSAISDRDVNTLRMLYSKRTDVEL